MSEFIGQLKLLDKINNYSIQTLPKTLLFLGPRGCGKRQIVNYVKNKFGLDLVEIDDKVDTDTLSEFSHKTIKTLYLIDLDKFTEKQQNQFLKFIEEPSDTVYILLVAESEIGILSTILNRCIKHHFEPYTIEQLKQIIKNDIDPRAFEIFKTPGKLQNLTTADFINILELAEKIVYKVQQATFANTMSINTKLNYKDLYNKIDPELLLDTVEYIAFEDFKNNKNDLSFTIFKVTNQFKQHLTQKNLIKETLILNYLTTLWEATH